VFRRMLRLCLFLAVSFPSLAHAAPVITTPSALNFGNTVVMSLFDQDLTIQNTGDTQFLSVSSIQVSGSGFSLPSGSGAYNIPIGQTVHVPVRFYPTTRGLKSGTITIASNDPVTPTKIVPLLGTGVAPVLSTQPPSVLNFGTVAASSFLNLNLTISNVTTDGASLGTTLQVNNVAIAGNASFTLTPPGSTTVPPGSSIIYVVRFAPTSGGLATASLTISCNDPLTPTKVISLSGIGAGPNIATSPPGPVDFGSVEVQSSADIPVVVRNGASAQADLVVSAVMLTGPDTPSFAFVGLPALPWIVPHGDSVSFIARFHPLSPGTKLGNISIASNDAFTPTKNIALQGTGTAFLPHIDAVVDVPNDQGGKVMVRWLPSSYDTSPSYAIASYTLWRRILTSSATALPEGSFATGAEPGPGSIIAGAQSTYWEFIATVPANAAPGYAYMATTGSDSLPGAIPWNVFFVQAKAAASNTYYTSPVDSGYSVDNLSPSAPAALTGNYAGGATHLHWSPNAEPDLYGYRLYRGSSAGFVPGPGNLIAAPADTGFSDPVAGAFYKLTAIDVHGNESPAALLSPQQAVDATETLPKVMSLAITSANPSPSDVRLRFALPTAGEMRLVVYNVTGRVIRELEAGMHPAGNWSARWDGRDGAGRAVGSGIYMVRLTGKWGTATVRCTLLH